MTCIKCNKPAIRKAKRTDNFQSIWGGKEWREYCLKHLTEQVGKYPLEIRDIISINMVNKAFNLTQHENDRPDIIYTTFNNYKKIIQYQGSDNV